MSKCISQRSEENKSHVAGFRDAEDGSFIIFSLFLFLAIILIGGIGVDILRHDYARVRMQNTADAAALAASDLDQTLDAQAVVESTFDAAGVRASLKNVEILDAQINRSSVQVNAETQMKTWFMRLAGVNTLKARASGIALEEVQDVEISLVLDVSGSMKGARLSQLKVAAKKFVNTMLRDRNGSPVTGKISINIVPYSAQVTLDDHILSRLPLDQAHNYSNCLEFRGSQFGTTAITGIGNIRQHAHIDRFKGVYHTYDQDVDDDNLDCKTSSNRRVTLMEDNISVLENRIDALYANGNTSTEFGLKVGAALLDPSARPVLAGHPSVKNSYSGRPYDYNRANSMKVVVVMSDGQNTLHTTFADNFAGDSYSDTYAYFSQGRHYFSIAEQERGYVDGDWDKNELYYRPVDDYWRNYVRGGNIADRLTWQDVFGRVNLRWHALLARAEQAGSGDDHRNRNSVFNYWMNAPIDIIGPSSKDADTAKICDAIKAQEILVFSIAFEISETEAALLKSCATNENLHYNVSGYDLDYAFKSIATSLNSLQLIQ